eukprot:scaffold132439_cov68-Cyclotella_meneghiniana.AAC.1
MHPAPRPRVRCAQDSKEDEHKTAQRIIWRPSKRPQKRQCNLWNPCLVNGEFGELLNYRTEPGVFYGTNNIMRSDRGPLSAIVRLRARF